MNALKNHKDENLIRSTQDSVLDRSENCLNKCKGLRLGCQNVRECIRGDVQRFSGK